MVAAFNAQTEYLGQATMVFCCWVGGICISVPEEFVDLHGRVVRSSEWFGISLVQFNSLVTSLSEKFVQLI